MFSEFIDFLNLLLTGILAGSMFCVWLVFNPAGLDSTDYLVLQQQGVRHLHPQLPVLGAASILVTILAAILHRQDGLRAVLLVGSVACLVVAAMITRFHNQPINAIVMTWNPRTIPADWTTLRDRWWLWHKFRLIAGLGGLVLLIASVLRHE